MCRYINYCFVWRNLFLLFHAHIVYIRIMTRLLFVYVDMFSYTSIHSLELKYNVINLTIMS